MSNESDLLNAVIKEASCQEALAALDDHESLVVDLRYPEEYALYGQIAGAHLIPWKLIRDDAMVDNQHFHIELKNAIATRKTNDVKIYFICNNGNRSRDAAKCILDMFGNASYEVYNVVGGINEWVSVGLPTSPVDLSA